MRFNFQPSAAIATSAAIPVEYYLRVRPYLRVGTESTLAFVTLYKVHWLLSRYDVIVEQAGCTHVPPRGGSLWTSYSNGSGGIKPAGVAPDRPRVPEPSS